jgi:uncharacterized protein YycO
MTDRNIQTVKVIFTTRPWNPVSWLIRMMLRRSALRSALSSHAIIELCDGTVVEASMLHGVRRVSMDQALKGSKVITSREYVVTELGAGVTWLIGQVGTKYDFPGALGLVDSDRLWQKDDAWYCYELVATFLVRCGLDIFYNRGSITERELLTINPRILLTMGNKMLEITQEAIR